MHSEVRAFVKRVDVDQRVPDGGGGGIDGGKLPANLLDQAPTTAPARFSLNKAARRSVLGSAGFLRPPHSEAPDRARKVPAPRAREPMPRNKQHFNMYVIICGIIILK